MKKIVTLISLILFTFLSGFSHEQTYLDKKLIIRDKKNDEHNLEVYVCTGQYAYAYHSSPKCPGLSNCKGEIKFTDENYAVYTMKRSPCCRCWTNTGYNCKDDLKSYGGGGGSGGGDDNTAAIVAGVVIVGSAIILSNDVYVYPSFSLKNGVNSVSTSQMGWSLGFRKTFKKSALEYGISLMQSNYYEVGQTAFNFSYVYQINKAVDSKYNFYVGPTIVIADKTGYGGIVGYSYKLLDRLKLDFRYEITNYTNNVKLGLIFKYQKKYFWQK